MLCDFSRKEAFEQQVTEECISHVKNAYRQKENKEDRAGSKGHGWGLWDTKL